ncbi:hypothetical protein AMK59_6931 [Oryctes borbonicus]|uniref:BED-type domain-containing protein n=1 Tax=Oryctes borbonicus TaxID=1629725 RepID=A0A0T6AW64_9SCAR|nr:hypothetical protein AMK59_6931 [Oryctes borbonicus]
MPKKTSNIWQYCTVLDRTHAKCMICKQRLSYKSSITNIKRHLARKHPEVCQYVVGNGNPYHVETIEIKPGTAESEGADCGTYDESVPVENDYNLEGTTEIVTTCGTFHIIPKVVTETNADDSPETAAETSPIHAEREIKKQKTSNVWQHCTPIDREYARCNICEAVLSYRTSITNIKKHLVRKHNFEYPACGLNKIISKNSYVVFTNDDEDQSSTLQTPNESTPTKIEPVSDEGNPGFLHSYSRKRDSQSMTMKSRLDNKLLDVFIKDYQPFRIVEDVGFRSFVRSLNSCYVIPSKQQIVKCLATAYGKCLTDMKEHAQHIKECCLTTECWNSELNDGFIAVTVHFINEEFTIKSILLECLSLNVTTNIVRELQRITDEWGISEKILLAVSDNDTSVQAAMAELEWNYFGCFAHTINSMVQDVLFVMDVLLEKVKSVVVYFKTNPEASAKLEICQKSPEINGKPKKVYQDDGRWISTLRMLERFLELEEAIKQTSLLYQDTNLPQLTEDEWVMVKELSQVLKPFETVANFISLDKYTNASLVIVLTKEVDDALDEMLLNNFSSPIQDVIIKLKHTLQEQLGNVETSETLALCTYLDPRFKNLGFSSSEAAEATKHHLVELLSNKITEQSSNIGVDRIKQEPNSSFSIWQSFKKRVSEGKQPGTAKSKALIEIERYLEDELMDQHRNPLEWWREYKAIYPCMSVIAQEIMCALGTAVPSERIFSKSGYASNLRRSCLNNEEVKILTFLNSNSEIFGKKFFDV